MVPLYYLHPISDCLNCEFKFLVCYIITTLPLYYLHPIMPPKRLASFPASGKEPKRQKKVMTLHEKAELIDMVKEGNAAVGRHYGVNESTVRYVFVYKPFGHMDDGGRLRIELAASSLCSARRQPWLDGR